ncbi:Reticulon-domain-containing protein [Radiomyces spectabilis]|uniref:Reticulon-domain-containing protein n=1 Tax=Radiomyces spectabilis TaxID=64574 RepID=UPI00221FDC42|nr:Reticulon-domain-containing protein [Radiomyces spectabilis]KAI8388142.1 Reticulon-domain-containing protein [Radiomyces spectabilis]
MTDTTDIDNKSNNITAPTVDAQKDVNNGTPMNQPSEMTPPNSATLPAKKEEAQLPPLTTAPFEPSATKTAATNLANSFSKNVYTSPQLNFDEDPTRYVKSRVKSLIYWENPKRSVTVLSLSLSVLILTQYYSLLQIVAGFFTVLTGLNWIYVNTHKQSQRIIGGKTAENITHPHVARLQSKGGPYIPRDRVTRAAQLTVDITELIAQQLAKLVLIENNTRSAVAFMASYLIWTVAKYVSTKYLVGVFLVGLFTLPRLYLQNQDIIDSHVAQYSHRACSLAHEYGNVANQKAQAVYGQAIGMIKKTAAKKTE